MHAIAAAALALACMAAPPAPGTTDDAALARARADAQRTYASDVAAVSAYAALERLRAPFLEATDDPRQAIWLADAAEDALAIGLSIDGSGIATVAGAPTAPQRARATALLRDALAWTQRADRAARAAIAAGQASPELLARLDATELARRIPLLRGAAAVLAAWCEALPAADAPAILESAAMRLGTLRGQLEGGSRALADLAYGMACARLGRAEEADSVLAPIAARGAEEGSRVLAVIAMAECASPSAAGRRRALALLRDRHGAGLGDASLLALGDAEFRLARQAAGDATGGATAATPAWRGWMDAVAAAPEARRSALRRAALARIALHADDLRTGDADDPVVTVAVALARLADAGATAGRAQAAEALRAAIAAPTLDPGIRALSQLELGRAELLLGRPADGARSLLAFAEANAGDPASRHAIDAAVAAARGTGDAALLARVLGTATARFPDHPDHAAWRVELAALALSPDSPEPEREAAPRRLARARDAMDRADRNRVTDAALRADLAIAGAEAANEMLRPDDALAILARAEAAAKDPALSTALRQRMLEERIAALAQLGRAIEGDAAVRAAIDADAAATADAAARVLRRLLPADVAALAVTPPDPGVRDRALRLADFVQRTAGPDPARDEITVRALLVGGLPDAALATARRVATTRGDRLDALTALAEALWLAGGESNLAEAMPLWTRIAAAAPARGPTWWLAELRRLQILDRVNRNVDVIAPKVARLKAIDPALGGPELLPVFLDLAARHEAASR